MDIGTRSMTTLTTAAQDELIDAEAALEAALQKVREAMALYDAKETA